MYGTSTQLLVMSIKLKKIDIISSLVQAGIAKRQTASVYLKQLVEIGVLVETATTKEKLFIHPKLMQLLTEDSNEFKPY
jgi:hypothetical protein